jgi:hypothetical protein
MLYFEISDANGESTFFETTILIEEPYNEDPE